MNAKKILFITLGCVFFLLGSVGLFLPVVPTVPFYLLTLFFFANGSKRFHDWFTSTKLYEKYVHPYKGKKGLPFFSKLGLMMSVTMLTAVLIFFWARAGAWIPCVIAGVVWTAFSVVILFVIKTIRADSGQE